MTPHKQFFDMYEPISGRKVILSDNGMVEAVRRRLYTSENICEGFCTGH